LDLKSFIYRTKYRYARSLPLTVPVDIALELSSICNMRCAYCYHANQATLPFKKGLMTRETAFDIIQEAAELKVNSLKFNWKGESTLNKDFFAITDFAKSLAWGSTFIDRISNSNFYFPYNNTFILDSLLNQTKVKVSYDSFNRHVFEMQRANSNHKLITNNIDCFYNLLEKQGHKTKLVIQAVRTKLNKDEDIIELAKERWPKAIVSIRDMVEGRVDSDLNELTAKKRNYKERQACIQASARLVFNWEGTAFPCCPDVNEELALGNIHKKSLYDIFNSFKAKILRDELKSKAMFQSSPCKDCSSFETFKGYEAPFNS